MITIAWDIDDVLNDLMRCWFKDCWLAEHPDCRMRAFEGLIENPPERLIHSTREEYLASLDSFRLSKGYPALVPDPQILAWFERAGDKARHIALTGVPLKAAHISAEWVIRHFGRWVRGFHFVPSPRPGELLPGYGLSKADYLRWHAKVDLLIEDDEQNAQEAQDIGIRCLLISRPWNKSSLSSEGVLSEINQIIRESQP